MTDEVLADEAAPPEQAHPADEIRLPTAELDKFLNLDQGVKRGAKNSGRSHLIVQVEPMPATESCRPTPADSVAERHLDGVASVHGGSRDGGTPPSGLCGVEPSAHGSMRVAGGTRLSCAH